MLRRAVRWSVGALVKAAGCCAFEGAQSRLRGAVIGNGVMTGPERMKVWAEGMKVRCKEARLLWEGVVDVEWVSQEALV